MNTTEIKIQRMKERRERKIQRETGRDKKRLKADESGRQKI
jgi:hypothetical protein